MRNRDTNLCCVVDELEISLGVGDHDAVEAGSEGCGSAVVRQRFAGCLEPNLPLPLVLTRLGSMALAASCKSSLR